jgi:hypothetical protein
MELKLILAIMLLTGLSACAPVQQTTIPTEIYPLATPFSDMPAAGICAQPAESQVVVTILPGIPDPRCTRIRPDQTLKVVNQTGEQVQVQIGTFDTTIEPDGAAVFDVPFGKYLAPGVHLVQVTPCCSPELWLETPLP